MTDFEQYKKDDDQWFSTKLAHYERTTIPLLIFGSIHNAMGNNNHMIPYFAIFIHYVHPLSKFNLHVSQQLLRHGNPHRWI